MTVDINYVQNLTKAGQVYNDLDPKVVDARNHALIIRFITKTTTITNCLGPCLSS